MKPRAFISYAKSDDKEAARVEMTLKRMGLPQPWKDRYELTAGLDLERGLDQAITQECDIVLVIMSAESLHSEWVNWERKRAEDASRSGHHIQVIYVKVKEFQVPADITRRSYVDYSFPRNETKQSRLERQIRATEDLARFFINWRSLQRIGVYDVYCSYADMDRRRQRPDGTEGCDIHQFISSAEERIAAVGFFFGNLFGPDTGSSLALWAKDHSEASVDIYVPDPGKAPLYNLEMIYPYGNDIPRRIHEFIDRFRQWGRTMSLKEDVAQRFKLHLLSCCPTHSLLAVDPDGAYGRMIADITSFGNGCDYQMKVELRYPHTALYKRYRESLRLLELVERQTETVYTSHLIDD